MTYEFALILFNININTFLLAYELVKTSESVNIKERNPKKTNNKVIHHLSKPRRKA